MPNFKQDDDETKASLIIPSSPLALAAAAAAATATTSRQDDDDGGEAPKIENTETRLIITVFGMLGIFISPFVFMAWVGVRAINEDDLERATLALVSFGLLVWPMYASGRFDSLWVAGARYFVLPVTFGLASCSSNSEWSVKMTCVCLTGCAWLLLRIVRLRMKRNERTSNGSLRIMIIVDALPPKVDGVATFAEQTIGRLQEFGHEVLVVTSQPGPNTLWGARVWRLPGMSTPISQNHSISLPLPTIMLTMLEFQPHVLHLFEVSPLNLATFFYAHVMDVPVSFSHHTRLDLYVSLVLGWIPAPFAQGVLTFLEFGFYPLGDLHLTVSQALFKRVSSRGTRDVRLWNSGVAEGFDKSKRSECRRLEMTRGAPIDVPLVTHVGRLAPEKNSDELPEIIRATTRKMGGPDKVKFAIVGGGLDKERLVGLLSNDPNVYFCGFLRGESLYSTFASADVFFSPSTTEGFPLVFLEAMACGLTVVGPRAGGVPDGFCEGCEGFIYKPHDAESASDAIVSAIRAGSAMRDAAYLRGKTYSWSRTVRELEAALFDLVAKKRLWDEKWRDSFGWA